MKERVEFSKKYKGILTALHEPKPTSFKLLTSKDLSTIKSVGSQVMSNWKATKDVAKDDFKVLTVPFMNAIDRLPAETRADLIEKFSYFLISEGDPRLKGVLMYHHLAFVYDFDLRLPQGQQADEDLVGNLFLLNQEGDLVGFYIVQPKPNQSLFFVSDSVINQPNPPASIINSTNPVKSFLNSLFTTLLVQLAFIKYAPVENKVVGTNQRVNTVECKYINSTRHPVKVFDCTWFTKLVKSEGFNVRGHFRFQPCGKGKKDRTLIYINEFKKHGYTREAKRPLTEEELLTESIDG